MRRIFIALLSMTGCGPAVPLVVEDASSDETRGSSSSFGTETTVAPPGTADDPSVDDSNDAADGLEVGSGFIEVLDSGSGSSECDIWADDCPSGQKCVPWANDGGNAWNATRCSPIAEDAHGPGEPCTVEGSGVSGIDDCARHSMCWDVDPETQIGTCVAFCTGSEANPTCSDPCTSCFINGGGVLILCLPTCDPLLQDCREGEACYPVNDIFTCTLDAPGEMGALGDACEYFNACDPGLFCASPESVPNCAAVYGCCALICDALEDDPCITEGVECIPWYEEGEAPQCASGVVGGCLLPE